MTGVLMDFEAVMKSSRSLGIPSVTLASPRPVQQWCSAMDALAEEDSHLPAETGIAFKPAGSIHEIIRCYSGHLVGICTKVHNNRQAHLKILPFTRALLDTMGSILKDGAHVSGGLSLSCRS